MITCNHDPVWLLKTGMSNGGNVSCHKIRTKGFGSRIFKGNHPRPYIVTIFVFLIEKQIVRNSIRLFAVCFWAKTSCKPNMIFGDSRSRRQSFSPFTTRRSNKIVFATHPCDHVQASCLPHERFSYSFLLSPSSGAGKRAPRALSWLDLTIAEIFHGAKRNEISGT